MNEETSLPRGWIWTKLGEVISPCRETVQPVNFNGEAYLGMEHVEAQTMKVLGTVPSSIMKSAGLRFERKDVLYGRLRPYLNKVVQPDFYGLCSPEFIVFRPEFVDATLLRYFLSSPPFKNFASHLNAGDRPRVDWNQLEVFPFPLAPLEEQKRIALQLDTLFSEVDAGMAAIARARAKVKSFRASLLRAATSGELSAQWREQNASSETGAALLQRILDERRAAWEAKERAKRAAKSPAKKLFEDESWKRNYVAPKSPDTVNLPKLPESWCWASLEQIGTVDRGRSRHRPRNAQHLFGGPYPFIQTGDVRHAETFITSHEQTLSEAGLEQSKLWPPGTLCITIAANIAETAILSFDACFPDSVVGFDSSLGQINTRYVEFYFRTIQQMLEIVAPATAQKNINLDILRIIPVPLPPLAEQEWIVNEVERRLSLVSEAEETLDAAHKRAQSLKAAILARAFRGELVEQDPNDESAEVLLERIREARNDAPKRTKRGKSGQGSLF